MSENQKIDNNLPEGDENLLPIKNENNSDQVSKDPNEPIAQNTIMEVHHHPHHHHERKPFKEYLLEYIMIVLAVTTGFFAESFRESLKERNKEKEYIISMMSDAQTDTSKLNHVVAEFKKIEVDQDSLLMNLPFLSEGKFAKYFHYERSVEGFADFIYTDITIQQLKSSDGMRLIKNHKVVSAILAYDANVKKALLNIGDLSQDMSGLNIYTNEFFNHRILFDEIRKGKSLEQIEKEKIDIFRSHDLKDLDILYNKIYFYSLIFKVVENDMVKLRTNAVQLIKTLKTEYKIENE